MHEPKACKRDALHSALDEVLDLLPPGPDGINDSQASAFWDFVAAVAQGRGVAKRYDTEGEEAKANTSPSPAGTHSDRANTRYHTAALARFLLDVQNPGAGDRPLPSTFGLGPIVYDLVQMAEAARADWRKGDPLVDRCRTLVNPREGNSVLSRLARERIVQAVFQRGAAKGELLKVIYGDWGLKTKTVTSWRKEEGMDEIEKAAIQKGKALPNAPLPTKEDIAALLVEAQRAGGSRQK
jgi:hypothetical protein